MEKSKQMLAILLGLAMIMGVTPVFAADSGTNTADVTVTDAISIIVTGNAAFGSLSADNIRSSAQPIKINSTSNVAVDVNVKALDWTSSGGNMPLTALQWGGSYTPMTTSDVEAIDNLLPGAPSAGSAQDVNLYMQVPFGSLSKAYNTTVTWTAVAHS